jgi:hypothetical protein
MNRTVALSITPCARDVGSRILPAQTVGRATEVPGQIPLVRTGIKFSKIAGSSAWE